MQLKQTLKSRFASSGFNTDNLILTLLQIYHNINFPLNQDHLMYLVKEGLVCRNSSGKLELTIGIYQDEEDPQIVSRLHLLTDVTDNLAEYRLLFKGIRTGAMGDKQQVFDNLVRFCRDENQPVQHIINITQRYLEITEYPFNADNFIYTFKNGKEISPLRTVIEEQEVNYLTTTTKLI